MNYQPQVGDRVTNDNLAVEGTVLFVHMKQALVLFDGDEAAGLYGFDEIVKVEPRPKVREQQLHFSNVGWLLGYDDGSEPNARIVANHYMLPSGATVTVAVVCDLSGEPLEVQA